MSYVNFLSTIWSFIFEFVAFCLRDVYIKPMSGGLYPMKLVSQRTGLSPHVLRVWERRYGAVTPDRSDSNRRLYGDEEVQRLELMAALTRGGHSIGQIASLPLQELESLASSLDPQTEEVDSRVSSTPEEAFMEQAWKFVTELDLQKLRGVLESATVAMGISVMTERLIVPLIERIGQGWELGEISVAEEHAASEVIKEILLMASRPYAAIMGAPILIVATPSGQLHELGGMLVACTARRQGWEVLYMGASLPAEEIVRAAIRSKARAIGLSIVYPADDPELPEELLKLRRLLPDDVALLIGGRAAPGYQKAIDEIGVTLIKNLAGVRSALDALRTGQEK